MKNKQEDNQDAARSDGDKSGNGHTGMHVSGHNHTFRKGVKRGISQAESAAQAEHTGSGRHANHGNAENTSPGGAYDSMGGPNMTPSH